jgi:hypothetical protein
MRVRDAPTASSCSGHNPPHRHNAAASDSATQTAAAAPLREHRHHLVREHAVAVGHEHELAARAARAGVLRDPLE